jgi:hypothetical protein
MAALDSGRANDNPGVRIWLRRIAWLEPFWILAVGAVLLLPQRFALALPAKCRCSHGSHASLAVGLADLASRAVHPCEPLGLPR